MKMIFCHPPLPFVALILLFLQTLLIYLLPLIQLFLPTLDAFPLLLIPSFLLTLERMFAPVSTLLAAIPLGLISPLLISYLNLPWPFQISIPVQTVLHLSIFSQKVPLQMISQF